MSTETKRTQSHLLVKSTSYKTANELYSTREIKFNKVSNDSLFNIYGKFVSILNTNIIILEDYTLDCYFYVLVYNEIIDKFKQYFEPWFIFRFHRLKFTSSNPNYNENRKKLYFNFKEFSSLVIFGIIDVPEKFNFHISKTATIDKLDWKLIDDLRKRFCFDSCTPIADLNTKLELNKNSSVYVSFLAEIIEIKQVQLNKILLKVWDGTMPKFNVSHPINQVALADDFFDLFEVHEECDLNLHKRANGKFIFVLIEGESLVLKFNGKKPKDLVHFYNAKMSKIKNKICIEMKIQPSAPSDRQFIKFISENSNLGKLLMSRINQASLNTQRVTDFNLVNESNKDYEIRCSIIDLYPLDHIALDLVRMNCLECNLDETINNLFDVDLIGIEKSASVFYAQYQKNSEIQCPSCSNESCSFYFQIIFYLQDATGIQDENHRMFAFLSGPEAEIYLNLNPIKVVANDNDEQFNLMKKIDYLKEKLNGSKESFCNCYMIINSNIEQDHYKIKDIFVDLNEID